MILWLLSLDIMAMVSTKQLSIQVIIEMVGSIFTALPAMPRMHQLTGTLPTALGLERETETSKLVTFPMELQCFKLHTTDSWATVMEAITLASSTLLLAIMKLEHSTSLLAVCKLLNTVPYVNNTPIATYLENVHCYSTVWWYFI